MATGLLIIAVIYFAARGYFLSLPGVIARLCGLVSGYVVAFSLRNDLARLLASQTQTDLPPLVLKAISSAMLFFGTLLIVSFVINSLFKLIARLVPLLRGIFQKEAVGSRISGAVVNSAIGAALVLVGLWVYGFTFAKNTPPDDLQRFANRFGDSLFALTRRLLEDEQQASTPASQPGQSSLFAGLPGAVSTLVDADSSSPEAVAEVATIKGTAEIRSVENPEKHLYIERYQQASPETPKPVRRTASTATDQADTSATKQAPNVASMLNQVANLESLEAVLNNPELRKLAEDPAIRDKAVEMLQSNPEIVKQVLENANLQQLLNQLQNQPR